jgi:hypothetical protein
MHTENNTQQTLNDSGFKKSLEGEQIIRTIRVIDFEVPKSAPCEINYKAVISVLTDIAVTT